MDELINRLGNEIAKQLLYFYNRKRCVAEMKELGLIPEDYVEHYYIGDTEIKI